MNLFGFGKPTDPEAQEDQRLIEAGGLPRSATARLTENASRQGSPDHLFTSDMSVSELLLTHECGYEPLAQVMGTSVYHVGWQYLPGQTWGSINYVTGLPPSQELSVLTHARYEARRLAFGRLLQEVALVRADGVVAVRFEENDGNLPEGTIEFRAIGTAVRQSGTTGSHRAAPFLSNLSGQDHWALRKAGYKPVGFVFGNCSWYQVSGWRNQNIDYRGFGIGVNAEYPDFTQAFYQARELAATRLTEEARSLRAIGVVGVTIEPEIQTVEVEGQQGQGSRRDLLVQFTMYGTAIAYEDGDRQPLSPMQVVRLDDKDEF